MDLAERLEQLKTQNNRVPDPEAKEIYLIGLKNGLSKKAAAAETGRTPTWFRRRCNPEAHNYDPVFAERYERALSDNRAEIVETTFEALYKSAQEGNVRAQEKILAAYSDEFGFLRPVNAVGPVNVEQLQVFFGELPLAKLLELKEARDQARKALPPVIDQ